MDKIMDKMLQNAQKVEVYDMDLQCLGKADVFTEDAYGHFVLIFSEIPGCELPKKVFLVPYNEQNQDEELFLSYLCILSGETAKHADGENHKEYYVIEGSSEESDTLREDLRVVTSFPVTISPEGYSKSMQVEVKDISVGGIMFVSEEQFHVGQRISIVFMTEKREVMTKAEIKTRRPIHMAGKYGYGCKFDYLLPHTEAEIRRIVFNEDIIRHRRGY